MITHSDEGPEFEPDDPLAVILRPASDYLGPPPGRYEAIRRAAARRRLLRAAAGVGASCAVAALIALPLRFSSDEAPASPTVPLAPPPASSPPTAPTPSATRGPVSQEPTGRPRTDRSPDAPTDPAGPTGAPSAIPTPSEAPSTDQNTVAPVPENDTRP